MADLPTFAGTLVGRGEDVEELAGRVASARLVTVTGPAGTGKTRLAVEVARRADARFVDLAPLRTERLLAERVAGAFALGELRGRDLAALVDAAFQSSVLLVLDNCEHLIDACASMARALLAGCENVRILATSQQRLGVPGEVEWVVPPLELRTAAVNLFCQRAVAAHRSFVGSRDPEAIVEICRRLDANPLAIELAAARVRTLSPAEIATRLERRFQLLRSEPGTTEGRYQSLAAALDWSHDLLSGREKALLRRLSGFAGSFGFPAAEYVGSGGEVDPDQVLDVLSGLIAKSLVFADTNGPTARYRLAETVRLYAAHRLVASGEAMAVGQRHARWYTTIVEALATRGEGAPTLQEVVADVDNVRAALDWCLTHGQAELGLRLATSHMVVWEATGRVAEARDWLGRLLAVGDACAPSLRARARYQAAFAALLLGDVDAAGWDVEASLAASAEAGDPPSMIERTKGLAAMVSTLGDGPGDVEELGRRLDDARAGDDPHLLDLLVGCGHARLFRGEPVAAGAHFEELVALATRRARAGPLGTGLVGAGAAALASGECCRAGEWLRQGIAVTTASGDGHIEVIGRIWLAELARLTGDAEGARRQMAECVARARPMGAPYPLALGLLGLGRTALDAGDAEAARGHFDEALAVAGHARLGHVEAAALEGMGQAFLAVGDAASAEGRFERALAVAERCSERTVAARAVHQLAERARARGDRARALDLHHDALRRFQAAGARPGVADALDALGVIAVDGDDLPRASRLFGAAAAMRRAGGWAGGPVDVAKVAAGMARGDMQAAWAAGEALSAEEAVAYAVRGRGRRGREPNSLTRAEREVVALAVKGLTTAEIAERLFISPRTVHSHLRRVYPKLGVTSRRELRQRVAEIGAPD